MSLLWRLLGLVLFVARSAAPAAAAPKAAKPTQPWQHSYAATEPTCPDDGTPIGFDVPPPPAEERALAIEKPPGCTGLASVDAVCQCLQPKRQPVCELVKDQGRKSDKLGELAVLGMTYSIPEFPDPVHPRYLIRKIGGKWSAVGALSGTESSTSLEELPMSTGILLVARTLSRSQEQQASRVRSSGREHLKLCLFAASEQGRGTCYKTLTLATWSYDSIGAEKCAKAMHSAYRARVSSAGKVVVEHMSGRDYGRAGKYHL